MIHEISGDILLTSAHAIAHGVAPHDHFDRGLALSLREDWPAMYKDFRHHCRQSSPQPGALWAWAGVGDRHILCLFTQQPVPEGSGHPGHATLANVNHALHALRSHILAEKITSLALPKLATGVGGLKWEDVHPLVVKHLGDLPIPVFVYTTFHKGVKAAETLAPAAK